MYPKKVYMSLNCYLDNNKENKEKRRSRKRKKEMTSTFG